MSSTDCPQLFLNLSSRVLPTKIFPQSIQPPLLSERFQISETNEPDTALHYLEANNPRAIIITDSGLVDSESNKDIQVRDKVLAYVRNGGLLINTGHFTSCVPMAAFDDFFTCGLPWTHGAYHCAEFGFVASAAVPPGPVRTFLRRPYSMKVPHVKGARAEEEIFVPLAGTKTQSDVLPARRRLWGGRVGSGYVIYIGDVNMEEEIAMVTWALCGV